MSCLGGTWQEPREWVRFSGGVPVTGEPIFGRVCDPEHMPFTSTRPRKCHGCPAYRGRLPDGTYQGVLAPDMETIQSLSKREYDEYVRWVEEEMDPGRFYEWLDEHGERGLTEDAQAEYMRRWRAAHPGYDKRRGRKRAAYMREYRARRNPKHRFSQHLEGAK